jgi:hypothetical protein
MARSNLVTTPHAVCYINSLPFARCCGLNYEILTPRREIRGVDILQAVEIVPIGASVHGTIQLYRLHQDGGPEAAGLVATFEKLTKEKYFSLMVKDRLTDTILIQVDRCVTISQSWSIVPKSYVTGTVTWTGFQYSNDAE